MPRIEWLERIAIENMKGREANMDLITREAHTTLTITLSALGVTVGYAIKVIEQGSGWGYVASFTALYLGATAFVLVWECLRVKDFPSVYNDPANLNRPHMDFDVLRMKEIENLQARIEMAQKLIAEKSIWLNRARVMLLATPLVVVFASMLFKPLG